MAKKSKKDIWFKRVRGSYLPCSWQGVLTYIPFLAFLLTTLIYNINTQARLLGAILIIFPQWVAAAVAMTWLASQKSK